MLLGLGLHSGFRRRPSVQEGHGLRLATSASFMLSSLVLLLLLVLSSLILRMLGGSGFRSREGVRLAGVAVTHAGVVSFLGLCV
jgi:small neutral amino acid transporter SnatA (MarC family)